MSTWTNEAHSVIVIPATGAGELIGFLSAVTTVGSGGGTSPVSWTNTARNSASFTNQTKS